MEKQKKLEERYLMLQLIDAQIREIERELSALENRNAELLKLKDSLDSLKKMKKGAKAYVPLGGGIFTEGTMGDTQNVLVNVGAKVIVKKDIPKAKELLDKQLKQSEEVILQLAQNLQTLAARAHEIEHEIRDIGAKRE